MERTSTYRIGSSICLLASIGSAAIAYSGGFIPFIALNLPAWIAGPLGVYTIVFAVTSSERYFYLSWGAILLSIGVASAFFNILNPILVVGILLIVLAVIGSIAYLKR